MKNLNETEKQIDENHKFRNMLKRWINYKVKIVSNVEYARRDRT